MKKPLRHLKDYISLCAVLSGFLILLIYFNGNPSFQVPIVILTLLSYILWGYKHHQKEGTYDKKVIFEYSLFGLLGSTIVIGLLIGK